MTSIYSPKYTIPFEPKKHAKPYAILGMIAVPMFFMLNMFYHVEFEKWLSKPELPKHSLNKYMEYNTTSGTFVYSYIGYKIAQEQTVENDIVKEVMKIYHQNETITILPAINDFRPVILKGCER